MPGGILHLKEVRREVPRIAFLERNLALAVREATKTDHGRMITLEDSAHRMLSFHLINGGTAVIRVANVDEAGKPFVHPSYLDALFSVVLKRVETFGIVYLEGERYDHFYHPGIFNDTDYLYVPNNAFVRNMVVILPKAIR